MMCVYISSVNRPFTFSESRNGYRWGKLLVPTPPRTYTDPLRSLPLFRTLGWS